MIVMLKKITFFFFFFWIVVKLQREEFGKSQSNSNLNMVISVFFSGLEMNTFS